MKTKILIRIVYAILPFVFLSSCNNTSTEEKSVSSTENEHHAEEIEEAMLSQNQFEALEMKIDSLSTRKMSGFIEANGELEVPPQNEANVTAIIGANVVEIEVIEGEQVKKGSRLAYISHPDIIKLQTEFANVSNRLIFLEQSFNREKKLYDAGVGSGADYQKAESEYKNAQRRANGLRAELNLLHLSANAIANGKIYKRIPIISPIDGAVQKINVKTGQYVQAQTNLFEIVNTEHVHADLMVFEKDISKLKVGQDVTFKVEALAGVELDAQIISIGKIFEQETKALHVHAEIKNKPENLVPGMYVRGKIYVANTETTAFPEEAIAKNGDRFFVFRAEREGKAWSFRPQEIIPGANSEGWTAIKFVSPVGENQIFVMNNAYYLMAEMKKGEGGGHHH